MKIFLVRHAKDDDRFRGGWSNLDLTHDGVAQAERLADFLAEKQVEYGLSKIISSDLLRARHTTDIINGKLKISVDYLADWREINNGDLAGMENDVAKVKYPGLFFSVLKMDEKYPDGESPADFYSRIKKAFEDLCGQAAEADNILLVTHGGVINIIYHIIQKTKWNNKNKAYLISYASLHVIKKINGEYRIGEIK